MDRTLSTPESGCCRMARRSSLEITKTVGRPQDRNPLKHRFINGGVVHHELSRRKCVNSGTATSITQIQTVTLNRIWVIEVAVPEFTSLGAPQARGFFWQILPLPTQRRRIPEFLPPAST